MQRNDKVQMRCNVKLNLMQVVVLDFSAGECAKGIQIQIQGSSISMREQHVVLPTLFAARPRTRPCPAVRCAQTVSQANSLICPLRSATMPSVPGSRLSERTTFGFAVMVCTVYVHNKWRTATMRG